MLGFDRFNFYSNCRKLSFLSSISQRKRASPKFTQQIKGSTSLWTRFHDKVTLKFFMIYQRNIRLEVLHLNQYPFHCSYRPDRSDSPPPMWRDTVSSASTPKSPRWGPKVPESWTQDHGKEVQRAAALYVSVCGEKCSWCGGEKTAMVMVPLWQLRPCPQTGSDFSRSLHSNVTRGHACWLFRWKKM